VVLTFYLLEKQKSIYETQTDMKNMASQYALQAAYYAELKNNLIATNKNTHDIKNFAAALSAYLEAGKTAEAKERLDEFIDKIPNAGALDTGNMAINALLHAKAAALQKIGKNSLSIALPPELAVDEIDLCVLIGNAIDNALEACSQIENEEERYINIKIFPFNNCLSLLFENSCAEKAEKDFFVTGKQQAFMHGFGLENMRALCAKYNGNLSFEQAGGKFSLSILLPN
jgi:sensor histidine kinase regulating citrate/malate metabolism